MPNHLIKTLHLDITANSEKEGFKLQQGFSELFRTRLSQKMEDIFDEFGSDQNIKIENLELEVQGVEAENWEEDFIEKFSDQLIKKLKGLKSNTASSPSSNTTKKKTNWKLFLFFLKNGILPWDSNQLIINDLNDFVKKEIASNRSLLELQNQLNSDARSLERLINQLQLSTLELILNKISDVEFSLLPTYKILENTYSKWWNKNDIKLEIWKIAFQFSLNNSLKKLDTKTFEQHLQFEIITKSFNYFSKKKRSRKLNRKQENNILDELKSNFNNSNVELSDSVKIFFQQNKIQKQRFPKKLLLPKTKKQPQPLEEKNNQMEGIIQDGIFINNAGLVLLNPYLNMLFEKCQMLENNNFKGEYEQIQAALILQYLTTNELSSFEHELPLNKILCNIPLEKPIPTELFLTEGQMELCESLLNAVIQHWSSLGNTSIQGLQGSFLNRSGKLTKKENGDWLLQVETKSFDILLSSLPWTISVIKLPWMEQKMMVDWQ